MTATPVSAPSYARVASGRLASRRVRPHGLDLAVMRLSLAMLLWARRHSDRAALQPTHDEQARRLFLARERARREHEAAVSIARVF